MKSRGRLKKFRKFLSYNDIGVTKGYDLVKKGRIRTVKIDGGTYITDEEEDRFVASLLEQAA